MENVPTPSSSPQPTRRRILIISTLVLVGFCVLFFGIKTLKVMGGSLADAMPRSLPMMNLHVRLYDTEKEKYQGHSTLGLLGEKALVSLYARCSDVQTRGDHKDTAFDGVKLTPTPLPAGETPAKKGQTVAQIDECQMRTRWNLMRHPVALSFQVQEGDKFVAWLKSNKSLHLFAASQLGYGLLSEIVETLKMRAQDLMVADLADDFLLPLMFDALQSKAALHVDPFYGKEGLVFTFERKGADFASRALLLLAKNLSLRGYRVTDTSVSFFELTLGSQRLFLTEQEGRFIVSTGISSLLNALDEPRDSLPQNMKGTIVGTLRLEAYLHRLLPLLAGAGAKTWQSHFSFQLDAETTKPQAASVGPALLFDGLAGTLSEGLATAIPHDIFAGLALSVALPKNFTAIEMRKKAESGEPLFPNPGNVPGGIALLWDLDGKKSANLTDIGIVIAETAGAQGDFSSAMKTFVTQQELIRYCEKGKVWMVSSSSGLLTRMKEACDGNNRSMEEWAKPLAAEVLKKQAFLFVNPQQGLREAYRAGGGFAEEYPPSGKESSEEEPAWKKERAKALHQLAADTEKSLMQLPIFGYAGGRRSDGGLDFQGFVAQAR